MLVEYDDEQHVIPESYYNRKNLACGGFDYVAQHDDMKDKFCISMGRTRIRAPHTVTGVDAIGVYIEEKIYESGLGFLIDGDSA